MPYFVSGPMAAMPRERVIDELVLPLPAGDWTDFGDYSEHVKVWLPKSVADAAARLAEQFNHSTTIIVRNALVIHVYGRLTFEQLVLHRLLRAPRGYVNDVVNSKQLLVSELELHRAGQLSEMALEDTAAHKHLVAQDGAFASARPIVALRVSVPKRLKDDLSALAQRMDKPLSVYCREVLTSYYLGALRS